MLAELLKHLSEVAAILAAAALALVGVVFALFIKPKLKEVDDLILSHGKLTSHIETLRVADNLNALQQLQRDVIVLQQSEMQRNERLSIAIDGVNKTIDDLENEINGRISGGDKQNLERLLAWRVDQLETSYALSKIQGGIREEEARDKWFRAKDEFATFLAQHHSAAGTD